MSDRCSCGRCTVEDVAQCKVIRDPRWVVWSRDRTVSWMLPSDFVGYCWECGDGLAIIDGQAVVVKMVRASTLDTLARLPQRLRGPIGRR